jgi:hypothetical protein
MGCPPNSMEGCLNIAEGFCPTNSRCGQVRWPNFAFRRYGAERIGRDGSRSYVYTQWNRARFQHA